MCRLVNALTLGTEICCEGEEMSERADEVLEDVKRELD